MLRRDASAFRVCVMILLLACIVPASSAANQAAKLYIGHSARLTAQIPSAWKIDPRGQFDYVGLDGFISSEPVSGPDLDKACESLASSRFDEAPSLVKTTLFRETVCRLDGLINGADVASFVIPHQHPFESFDQPYHYAAVITDPRHLETIGSTVDFSPDRVTPKAYVTSVLDIVEARSYWSNKIDWDTTRTEILASVDGLETLTLVQGTLLTLLQKLQAAGDNHSFLLPPGPGNELNDANGFGRLVGGSQVILVYPDSPAGRAGLQIGDIIESING